MFSKMMARMVERAMPGALGERHHELIAAETAENAIRQTARLALLVGFLALVLAGALVYVYIPGREVVAPPAVAPESLKQLNEDNAKLTEQNQELQKKIDDLTKEREALQTVGADLEKRVADLAKKSQPTDVPLAAAPPSAPRRVLAAVKPPALTKPAVASKVALRPPKKIIKPARARAATARLQPAESFHCGDGRTVPDPTRCTPASTATSPPTEQLALRPTYQCGDGRTAHDPTECRSPRSSPSARSR